MAKNLIKTALFSTVFGLCIAQSDAQEPRYSTWSDPSKPQASHSVELDKMIKELQGLVSEAERARAADPKFLSDLKSLAARYGGVTEKLLFKDDFSDGNFTQNPTWAVSSGKYWIEKGYGLRSVVEKGAQSQNSSSSQQQKISKEELIIGVLGAVLGGKVQQQPQQQQAVTPKETPASVISLSKPINNAFRFEINLSSWQNSGHLEFGPYQGTNQKTGYRLVYQSGSSPALQLVRHYSSSSTVVGSYKSVKLEDQKNHKLVWTRSKAGRMAVSLDDKLLMDMTDQGFRDDFSGLVLSNKSGDFTIKSISAFGS
ncbi:conserved exported hypothetical protein [Candidatus Terasakiella magnetica]|uniref:Uncharacterized protein n=1 Tax=Candidatus Terasakiella magnetica TaxID=1867952 RepID=A0A1C3RG96_9PROT|nr:hypothetical protein [Candidatus Terasakiella magnetica]SCA56310.1 conserved exported hypothetical protein [Candidatus Terasakiella magnetica]